MGYLYSSGEVITGIVLLVLWWFALRLFRTDKPLSTLSFAFWPCLFLLWIVGALIMIARSTTHAFGYRWANIDRTLLAL